MGGDSERRLCVRVRQICDVLMGASLPSTGSQMTPMPTSMLPSPRRCSHAEVVGMGAGVDVDVDTDDGEEGAEVEVETDCLTSCAPSRAVSPLPPPPCRRPLAMTMVHSGVVREMGEAEAEAEGAIVTVVYFPVLI